MEGQRGEAGPTNQSPGASEVREVCCRRLPNGYVELILIGAIAGSRLSLNLRKRALPLLPRTAQRCWLGIAFLLLYPFVFAFHIRMICWPSIAMGNFMTKNIVKPHVLCS
jgi:hypothetical protein